MMRVVRVSVLCCAIAGLLVAGCGGSAEEAAQAQRRYGASVDATTAVPAPAVAAEDSLYAGHALTVDGRITKVGSNGCEVRLDTGMAPLVVMAARTDAGDCTWTVPRDAQGFAVAAGTLRVAGGTLRLTANGVRVTPVRLSNPDS